MDFFFYTCLFIFGSLFGSFWSVIIYRLKSAEWWIMNGRSHCAKCNTILNTLDLIPIFSWIFNKAKCRYCKEKISSIYPILELSTWILFSLIWYFLIDYSLILNLNVIEITKLFFWLIIWFITILYIFYDILFLEIHEWIMLTWIWIIFFIITAQTLSSGFNLIDILPPSIDRINSFSISLSAIFISIIIIWILYIIMLKELHEIIDILLIISSIILLYLFKMFTWINLWDIAIINWIIWALSIFIFFFLQILISGWSWLWWWDLRIAIMIGLILWINFSFPWLMITYFVWSLIWIIFIIHNRIKNKWQKFNTQIPFGPFLAIWFFLTIFFNNNISNIMSIYFQ